jgi:hypothetical protein
MGTNFRPRSIRAAFYDGRTVGERLPDGTVRPDSCPDWFPAVVPETHAANTWAEPGEIFIAGGTLIVGGKDGGVPVHPGAWIVSYPDRYSFDVMGNETFERLFEPARD